MQYVSSSTGSSVADRDVEGTKNGEDPFVPRVVGFYISLTWPIAMPDGHRFTANREEVLDWLTEPADRFNFGRPEVIEWLIRSGQRNFVTFMLRRWPHTVAFPLEQIDAAFSAASTVHGTTEESQQPPGMSFGNVPAPLDVETYGVVIEAVTGIIEHPTGDFERSLDDAFGRCLEELEPFVHAYGQTVNDLRATVITPATVPSVIPAIISDPFSHRASMLMFHANWGWSLPVSPPEDLTPEQVEEVMLRWSLVKKGQPMMTYVERARAAQRAFRLDGDYPSAVIACHTAGEVFFDALLLMLAWEEIHHFRGSTLTKEHVIEWFKDRSTLGSRLGRHYHGRLTGGWHPAQSGSPLANWRAHVSRLRNRTVHAGYRPKEHEAALAIQTLDEVEGFVKTLLLKDRNRTRYPRTVFMIIGVEGLQRRGLFGGQLKRLIETSSEDWAQSFGRFRRWVDDQLGAAQDADL